MPVKWTPDYDQLLLLKILETHDISVDAKKISAAWPAGKGEIPTARAVTERLVKIRQLARANGSGHFGISSSQAKTSSGKTSVPRTPSKPSPLSTNRAPNARLNSVVIDDDDEPMQTPKRDREDTSPIKMEPRERNSVEVIEEVRNQWSRPSASGTPLPSPAANRQMSTSRSQLEGESPTKKAKVDRGNLHNGYSRLNSESVVRWRSQAPSVSTIFDDEEDAV